MTRCDFLKEVGQLVHLVNCHCSFVHGLERT